MSAAVNNFILEEGVTRGPYLKLRDSSGAYLDFSIYTAIRMQVRANIDDADPLFELSLGNGLSANTNKLLFDFSDVDFNAITVDTAVYDILSTDEDNYTDRLVQGIITFSKAVTR